MLDKESRAIKAQFSMLRVVFKVFMSFIVGGYLNFLICFFNSCIVSELLCRPYF